MCASETVAAAIEYLEELHAESSPLALCREEVVLHRMIPASLTILRSAHRTCVAQESRGEVPKGPALDLAAAILGGIA